MKGFFQIACGKEGFHSFLQNADECRGRGVHGCRKVDMSELSCVSFG
jgi:hypothetical protein